MAYSVHENGQTRCDYETALNLTGFGKYNIVMLISCCFFIFAMYMDIFGLSIVMPAVACDLNLTTSQQGLLTAIPLIGVMISSYAWGLCADTLGRRKTLLIAMPTGATISFLATMTPTYSSLVTLKFLSASFTSSANAAAFVLLGESVPKRHRSRFMYFMVTATMLVQLIICAFALPVLSKSFHVNIPWLRVIYRPWRLLMQIISLPGVIASITMAFLDESPKFLLSRNRDDDAIYVFQRIYRWNSGRKIYKYPVVAVSLDDDILKPEGNVSFIRQMWNQTAPLFKPPLLKNSLKLYYILLCSYMTSTGYTMWVPTMTNAYFNGDDRNGQTFCEVASQSVSSNTNSTTNDCNKTVKPLTLYAVILSSAVSAICSIALSFIVNPLGKKKTTILIFIITILCGFFLLFVKTPLISLSLFFVFLYIALILGNVNSYLIELNPTHLRGMATCISVVVARGFGFFSVQLIASLLADYCTPMISGYLVLLISGLIVVLFLPPDAIKNDIAPIEYNNVKVRRM